MTGRAQCLTAVLMATEKRQSPIAAVPVRPVLQATVVVLAAAVQTGTMEIPMEMSKSMREQHQAQVLMPKARRTLSSTKTC